MPSARIVILFSSEYLHYNFTVSVIIFAEYIDWQIVVISARYSDWKESRCINLYFTSPCNERQIQSLPFPAPLSLTSPFSPKIYIETVLASTCLQISSLHTRYSVLQNALVSPGTNLSFRKRIFLPSFDMTKISGISLNNDFNYFCCHGKKTMLVVMVTSEIKI